MGRNEYSSKNEIFNKNDVFNNIMKELNQIERNSEITIHNHKR
jgi:hypothetical protein